MSLVFSSVFGRPLTLNFAEEDHEEEVSEKIDAKECLQALMKVRTYCQQRNFSMNVHESLKAIEKGCVTESVSQKVQKNITDFFK